jgi:hypothetical protein
MESGVANNPLITKRKTFCFGRFIKQNKKDLQVKSPLEEKCIYIVDLSQPMEIYIYYFNTSTFTFSLNNLHLLCTSFEDPKKNLRIPSLLSSQIAQTLETSSSK